MDTNRSAIIGLIDLFGNYKISDKEYYEWDVIGKWESITF